MTSLNFPTTIKAIHESIKVREHSKDNNVRTDQNSIWIPTGLLSTKMETYLATIMASMSRTISISMELIRRVWTKQKEEGKGPVMARRIWRG